MKRNIFDKVLLVVALALISSFVLSFSSLWMTGTSGNMYYNQFLSGNARELSVFSSGNANETPVISLSDFGSDYAVYKSIKETNNQEFDSVRGVYAKGNVPTPQLTSGRYFTQEEFEDENAFFAVVGGIAVERSVKVVDGKEIYTFMGVDYEVIGHIGTGASSDIDNMVLLNLRAALKSQPVYGYYVVDSEDSDNAVNVFKKFMAQFSNNAALRALTVSEIVIDTVDIYLGRNRFFYCVAFVLLCVNAVITCCRYVNRQKYKVAVKKLLGVSSARVCAELILGFFALATVGFAAGAALTAPFSGNLLSIVYNGLVTEVNVGTVLVSYTAVIVIVTLLILPLVVRLYRLDTSVFLKAKE